MICAFTVIPLAYYAISLRHHPRSASAEFWWTMITKGPWPSGPIWFLWVLFAFDLIACLLYRLSPNMLDPINRLSAALAAAGPRVFFAVMLAVTAAFYYSRADSLRRQAAGSSSDRSRCSTGACYSMRATSSSARASGLRMTGSRVAVRQTAGWRRSAGIGCCWRSFPYYLMWVLISIKRENLGNPADLPDWYEACLRRSASPSFSVAILFLILAYFLRFASSGRSVLDLMQPDAYGMFPGALSDRALVAILAIRLRLAGDREGTHWFCVDRRHLAGR